MAESDRRSRSRSGSRRREFIRDLSPPSVVVKASKKKAVKHAVGLEEAEREMVEQVARSALERQLRSDRREARRKEEADVSEGASGAALEAERTGTTSLMSSDINDVIFKEVPELRERMVAQVRRIVEIAAKSKNLKGDFVRDLKVAAKDLGEIVENLAERCLEGDEGRRLERDNNRLRARVSDLESEICALRRDFTERTARSVEQEKQMVALRMEMSRGNKQSDELAGLSVNGLREIMAGFVSEVKGELLADMMRAVGGMMDAKLAGIGDRLLPRPTIRPPLAASRVVDVGSFGGVEGLAARRETSEVGNVVMEVTENWSTVTGKKGKKSKAVSTSKHTCGTSGVASSATPLVKAVPPEPLRLPVGGLSQAKPGLRQNGLGGVKYGQAERNTTRTLVEPTTAAVVLTLRKEAAERGHTYAALLSRAKQDISLTGLGIERVSVRTTATGARMLEIPGSQRGEKADRLAASLREVLADVARVERPVKCADLYIRDLDDSITVEEVVAAVAAKGGCSAHQIKPGQILRRDNGMGDIFILCPISAAKKVAEGRLLIGWSSARVEIREERPLRCFKCMRLGHTREVCTSEVDLGMACYRCGKVGHKAGDCGLQAHCVVCASAGVPAGHKMGGRACKPPPISKGGFIVAAEHSSPEVFIPGESGAMSD